MASRTRQFADPDVPRRSLRSLGAVVGVALFVVVVNAITKVDLVHAIDRTGMWFVGNLTATGGD